MYWIQPLPRVGAVIALQPQYNDLTYGGIDRER
jgi:hypothetical protein